MAQTGGRSAVKRSGDLIGSMVLLLLLSPVLLLAAAAVRVTLGSPVLFRQPRLGYGGQQFTVWKLRTMTDATGPDGQVLSDADRLTRLGAFLRASSVDELPELWNVVRGEMSLVGPRPLLLQYKPLYTPEQARRHEVLPGITGWAQINGRNTTTWEERFALDTWYVDNWTLRLDVRILLRTVRQVFRRDGITFGEHATMPVYEGSVYPALPSEARPSGQVR